MFAIKTRMEIDLAPVIRNPRKRGDYERDDSLYGEGRASGRILDAIIEVKSESISTDGLDR